MNAGDCDNDGGILTGIIRKRAKAVSPRPKDVGINIQLRRGIEP